MASVLKTYPAYRFLIAVLVPALIVSAAGAKTVTDQAGRTMQVPGDPKRIVSLAPSITEIIFDLKRGDRLVGVTRFSDYPPEARGYPKVGSYVHPDLEKIVSLNPDLCIAVKDGNPIDIVKRLESMSIPVYAVDPKNFQTVVNAVADIGALLNAKPRADQRVREMKTRISRINALTDTITERPRVFFQIGVSPIVAVGTDTFIHEMITTAGGINLTVGPTPYPRFTKERIIALAPDIMIITSMARNEIFERVKRQWEEWPTIPAVKNGRIHLVDSNLFDRPAPRMTDGLEALFRLFYPSISLPKPSETSDTSD